MARAGKADVRCGSEAEVVGLAGLIRFCGRRSGREITAAFETETGRVAISMSIRLAAEMLQKLQQLDLPRRDAQRRYRAALAFFPVINCQLLGAR